MHTIGFAVYEVTPDGFMVFLFCSKAYTKLVHNLSLSLSLFPPPHRFLKRYILSSTNPLFELFVIVENG